LPWVVVEKQYVLDTDDGPRTYLLWQLRASRVATPLIEQAMSGIAARPRRVIERLAEVLSGYGYGVAGARLIVVGVAYKPGLADLRESLALEIISRLRGRGADVDYDWVDGLGQTVDYLQATSLARMHHARVVRSPDGTRSFSYTAHGKRHAVWFEDATSARETRPGEQGPPGGSVLAARRRRPRGLGNDLPGHRQPLAIEWSRAPGPDVAQ
jgi:hypothetical protein